MRQQAILYSAGLHIALLLFLIFGLPDLFSREHEMEPIVISLEPLPISDKSNVKPQERSEPEKKEPKKEPEKAKPAPPKKQDESKEKPEPVPAPKEKKPDKKKEEKKKDEKKEDKKKPKTDPSFDAVLKDLAEKARSDSQEKKKSDSAAEQSPAISETYDESMPLSITEKDAIVSQFIKCWRVPAGAREDYNLRVTVQVKMREDGAVLGAELAAADALKAAGDSYFRAAADSALRAVWKCSPLKNLPADKYGTWKDMELTFDPKYLLY